MIDKMGRNALGQPWRHRFKDDEFRHGGFLCWADFAREVKLRKAGVTVWSHTFDPTTTDCGPLVAYCEGHMPAYAFADWLEEQVSDFPPEGLAILRERAEGE